MLEIVVTFLYKKQIYLVDENGQVWTQYFNDEDSCFEFVKIGDIDLDAEITSENSRA